MVTIDRVSLWDRVDTTPEEELSGVLQIYGVRHPDDSADLIEAAFKTAYDFHDGQRRKSGEA